MHARVTNFAVRTEQQEDALRWLDETYVPVLRQQPGFKGFLVLNEEIEEEPGGEWLAITLWETANQASPGRLGEVIGGLAELSEQLKAVGVGLSHPRLYAVVRQTS
jgi:heme-degrading monooxygenase HmoA